MPARSLSALLAVLLAGAFAAHANGDPAADAGPAQVAGLWCGSGPLREFSLRLTQHDEQVEGELLRKGRSRTIEGRVEGQVLRTQPTKVGALVLEKQGEELRVTGGDGLIALVRGTSFHRSEATACTG
ncbi:hypothetical protein PE066_16115 [Ramlibacter tataouinensis]|uniref:hypothetical protein n=1 Tax=Ramlibacter tataouinensis TaxID=94132 RepID=UPI0022F39683|nr:hypothetical protein [Ramlibacter tataouinensis]WBY00977.1 hypothetical protein PE066_16115 [Ramlibacter tataouinensis]